MKKPKTKKPNQSDAACAVCRGAMTEITEDPSIPRVIFFTRQECRAILMCLYCFNRCVRVVDLVCEQR